jgi:FSR family fosmidomycin resistance protein-like MFS transporter
VSLLLLIGVMMDANFYPLVLIANDAMPGRVGLSTGVTIGLSVGIGAAITSVLGAITDDQGPTTAMHAATLLAVGAFVVALPLAGRSWRRVPAVADAEATSPTA